MTRALVVYCHPDPTSFVHAAFERVVEALQHSGADVRIDDLYADGFEPELTADDHRRHLEAGVDPSLQRYADDLRWCDTLVLVYPTWWAGQPAMLKGWIDRVWACGIAWELPAGSNRLAGRLGNIRRLVVVTTHGSSKWVNAVEGEGGKRTVTRSLRAMCHPFARTHWLALYGLDTGSSASRTRFLDRIDRRMARLTGH